MELEYSRRSGICLGVQSNKTGTKREHSHIATLSVTSVQSIVQMQNLFGKLQEQPFKEEILFN